jgi:hypothetical protein
MWASLASEVVALALAAYWLGFLIELELEMAQEPPPSHRPLRYALAA